MPQIPPIPQKLLSGIDTVNAPDEVKDFNSPDSRNDNISELGVYQERPGTAKDNTTAHANPPLKWIGFIEPEDESEINMFIDNSGNLKTF